MTNKLDPRDYATFRHVWNLYESEQSKLDWYFQETITLGELWKLAYIGDDHMQMMKYKNIYWNMEYLECNLESLHNIGDEVKVSISFRYSKQHTCAIALIRAPRKKVK